MRSILLAGVFDADRMLMALVLNAIFMAFGYLAFRFFLASARVNGSLSQMGE